MAQNVTEGNAGAGEYLSPAELAELFGVPLATVYGWRHKGTGPLGVRVGRHVRYRRRDAERWFEAQAAAQAR